jgi:hypothetical protein
MPPLGTRRIVVIDSSMTSYRLFTTCLTMGKSIVLYFFPI